jgi:hypothetical protein
MEQLGKQLGWLGMAICPGFFSKNLDYNTLVYAYETTHDMLGIGVTAEKGWYACNSNTFTFTPFDIEEMPLIFHQTGIMSDENKSNYSIDDYFYEIAPFVKDYSYTITEKLIGARDNDCSVSYSNVFSAFDSGIDAEKYQNISIEEAFALSVLYSAFSIDYVEKILSVGIFGITVSYDAIYQIDPKFIPDTVATKESIPTKTSQLDNDSGYITSIPADYTTKEYVDNAIAQKYQVQIITWGADD